MTSLIAQMTFLVLSAALGCLSYLSLSLFYQAGWFDSAKLLRLYLAAKTGVNPCVGEEGT
jgi:hypothetical protein